MAILPSSRRNQGGEWAISADHKVLRISCHVFLLKKCINYPSALKYESIFFFEIQND